MATAIFDRKRDFDYLQIHWLEKTTGQPSHNWDLYILKELLDNALDGDERKELVPYITAVLHYRHNTILDLHSLEISVTNQASFPLDQIPDIFSLTSYASDKSHINHPQRGQQGNALKTILGIPYALRHHFYGDYDSIRRPFIIETGSQAHTISLTIDELRQQVQLAPPEVRPLRQPRQGTRVQVGIDRFVQEHPRTIANLHAWAQRFALANPHATFDWRIRIGSEEASWTFDADSEWNGRFHATAPVHWYEYTQLRELLLALTREQPQRPLAAALQLFAGFTPAADPNGHRAQALCQRLGFATLADLDLTNNHGQTLRKQLLPALQAAGHKLPAAALGQLGAATIAHQLTTYFELPEPPLYRYLAHEPSSSDLEPPFVLELAITRLPTGRRHIWTALNHTPTYEDPFFTRQLAPPNLDGQVIFGLDGFLDAYGLTADQPILLFMHIICPNIAYQDFAKTTIEARPFRQPLSQLLGDLLTEFTAVNQEERLDLQLLVDDLLPTAVFHLSPNQEPFALDQLLRALRRLLQERLAATDPAALSQLDEPDSLIRLQSQLQTAVQQQPTLLIHLIQPEIGQLTLPVHPDAHSSLGLSQITAAMLDAASVNKILLVTEPAFEQIIVANQLLTQFDMALLHSEGNATAVFNAALPHLEQWQRPLLLLHHATAAGCSLATQLQQQLDAADITPFPIHDLGLRPSDGFHLGLLAETSRGGTAVSLSHDLSADEQAFLQRQQFSLFGLTAVSLKRWLAEKITAVGLPLKTQPAPDALDTQALTFIKETIANWVSHQIHQLTDSHYLTDQTLQQLHTQFNSTDLLTNLSASLTQQLADQPHTAWQTLWETELRHRLDALITSHEADIKTLITTHLQTLNGESPND